MALVREIYFCQVGLFARGGDDGLGSQWGPHFSHIHIIISYITKWQKHEGGITQGKGSIPGSPPS